MVFGKKMRGYSKLNKAKIAGIISFLLSIVSVFYHPYMATIPLIFFIVLCIVAPFFPGMGFFFPIICRGLSKKEAVTLTFDDGPDPLITPFLLDLLSEFDVLATFYVTGKKAEMYPNLVRDILNAGHSIGNHTYYHDTLIMLKKRDLLVEEIEKTQSVLKEFGIRPLTFRPPVGISNPSVGKILEQFGMIQVNFSVKANDFGNRRIDRLSTKILDRVQPDDIIMLHDTSPVNGHRVDDFLGEVRLILQGLQNKSLAILPLSVLIKQEVMVLC